MKAKSILSNDLVYMKKKKKTRCPWATSLTCTRIDNEISCMMSYTKCDTNAVEKRF